ncbi:hypothetical protein SAMN05443636_3010 [Halobaculum gomorrense]|uniref:SipW-cognate class signal peptide n=1 Tax=Halobaculum gomorrense TaxID=43928 RepID=A0A1M5UES1_9EURY|nr:hypothetical protein SAMN05443636_3010 [Halobaculum gomorrense]
MLAGIGVTGLAGAAGLGLGTTDAVVYTASAQTESNGFALNVDWRETYNGQVLEDTRSAEWTADGPVISLKNVQPGDSGTFSFRIGVADAEGVPVAPRFSFDLTATPEKGINEPEEKAGDTSADDGELEDVVQAKFWRDDGLFAELDPLGGDNAVRDPGEPLIPEGTQGTLGEVASAFEDEGPVSFGCIDGDETITVSFGWAFPAEFSDGDVNVAQGDGVSFDLAVSAEQCDGGST